MDNSVSYVPAVPITNRFALGLPYIVALALAVILYGRTFAWWYYEWTLPGSFYAHAMFVPFFVCIMLWRNRDRLASVRWQPSWAGLTLIVPGVVLLLLARHSDVDTVQSLSFIFVLVGCSLLLLGTPKTGKLLFPLLFVMMMMPLIPDQLINGIAFPIQLKSAQLAVFLLNHLSLTSHQEGTQIIMEHYRMAVELPCSGFKTLLSLLTFAAAFAYLVEAPAWKRWLLFVTTAPLSLFINGLRIALIGVVGELVSTKMAQFFHDWSGLIVLILAFTFLFNFARMLKCERFLGVALTDEVEKRDQEAAKTARDSQTPVEPSWWQILLAWRPTTGQMRRALPQTLALDFVLLLSVLILFSLSHYVPVQKLPLATYQVPKVFSYNGVNYKSIENPAYETDALEHDQLELLSPIRVINRDYVGSDGSKIQLFMTAGNGRRVFHDPHNCALGSNASIIDLNSVAIPSSHETIRVQEAHFRQTQEISRSGRTESLYTEEKELMFCYVVEGKVHQSTSEIRNALIMQTFFGDGGQPSYFVRVFQQKNGTGPTERKQLINFIGGLWKNIGPILHGDIAGQPDAPPHPSRPMAERNTPYVEKPEDSKK